MSSAREGWTANGPGGEGRAAAVAGGAQTVDRACAVLLEIGRAGGAGARITDLTSGLQLSRPTVHRVLQSLIAAGFVTQDPASRRYRLGAVLHSLGLLAPGPHERLPELRRPLEELARRTGHTAYLMLRRGDEVACIARADSPAEIRTYLMEVGAMRPIGAALGGIAILAALPDAEVDAVLERTARVLARHRNATPEYVRLQVARNRRDGYCVSEQVYLQGATGFSALVPVPGEPPHLAVSISAISSHVTPETQPDVVSALRSTCAEMAAIAGARGAAS